MAYATLKLGATLLLEELCKSVRWYLSPPLCAWAAGPRRNARANTVSNRELCATGIALRTNLPRLFIYCPLSLSFEVYSSPKDENRAAASSGIQVDPFRSLLSKILTIWSWDQATSCRTGSP